MSLRDLTATVLPSIEVPNPPKLITLSLRALNGKEDGACSVSSLVGDLSQSIGDLFRSSTTYFQAPKIHPYDHCSSIVLTIVRIPCDNIFIRHKDPKEVEEVITDAFLTTLSKIGESYRHQTQSFYLKYLSQTPNSSKKSSLPRLKKI